MTITSAGQCLLVIASGNVLRLIGHHDVLVSPPVYPTTSLVVVSLFTARGVAVPDVQDMPMEYVEDTTGESTEYRCYLSSALALTKQRYVAKITATDDGEDRVYTISCPAVDRAT